MQKLTVPEAEAGRRLDKYLLKILDAAPKSFLYKAFRKKNIRLNGKRAEGNELLQGGDEILLFFSDETIRSLKQENSHESGKNTTNTERKYGESGKQSETVQRSGVFPAKFCSPLYEDENVLIVNKHSGVKSQKAQPGDYTLNEALRDYCGEREEGSAFVPSVCNRLDRNTSGLVLFAKTYGASRELSRILRERTVEKYYLAAVWGTVDRAERIRAWLKKDERTNTVRIAQEQENGAAAVETQYRVLTQEECAQLGFSSARGTICGENYTLLKIKLITGKTHQIRAHLAFAGHPLLGDLKYGSRGLCKALKSDFGVDSQLLHAWELVMPDSLAQPLGNLAGRVFRAELSEKFRILN